MVRSREAYEKAGGIAEEVFYHIKTVASFANFEYEKKRFSDKIEETYKAAKDTIEDSYRSGIVLLWVLYEFLFIHWLWESFNISGRI
jgi:hypothetical protein